MALIPSPSSVLPDDYTYGMTSYNEPVELGLMEFDISTDTNNTENEVIPFLSFLYPDLYSFIICVSFPLIGIC
jgi:hypothetical protein